MYTKQSADLRLIAILAKRSNECVQSLFVLSDDVHLLYAVKITDFFLDFSSGILSIYQHICFDSDE